jgi:hypothetical protein
MQCYLTFNVVQRYTTDDGIAILFLEETDAAALSWFAFSLSFFCSNVLSSVCNTTGDGIVILFLEDADAAATVIVGGGVLA